MKEGEIARIGRDKVDLWDVNGDTLPLQHEVIAWNADSADKRGYSHYMLKEIHEQTATLSQGIALSGTLNPNVLCALLQRICRFLKKMPKRVDLIACGTAFYAAATAKYAFEGILRIPHNVDLASEYRTEPFH